VLGWQRRQGRLTLTLVLADGSKSLIPAGWTDLEPGAEPVLPAALGSVADLLHACTVLAPLLRRIDGAAGGGAGGGPGRDDARQPNEEVARAAAPGPGRDPRTPPAVWAGLTGEQQAAVVALLARLIARMLTFPPQHQAEEADDAR
jgi:hypothetical protein